MIDHIGRLTEIALDSRIEYGDRADAIVELARYDIEDVQERLATLARTLSTSRDLAETCGEALAQIWCRVAAVKWEIFDRLEGDALNAARQALAVNCPTVMDRPSRNG